jgi:hypothetical protein
MKRLLFFITLFTMVLFTAPSLLLADTVDVAVLPPGNVNNVINGDTLAGGVRAHPDRVYRLQRGAVYQVTERFLFNGSVNIVASSGTARPPVLAPAILADNSSIDHFFDLIGYASNVSISNVYITCFRADQAQLGWSDGIRINADSVNLTLKGCIFDGFSHTAIQLNNWWAKMDVQDCTFRNEMHGTSWFGGGAFLSGAGPAMDTCKFINNTFYCNNSYLWSIRGYDKYSLFDHNTIVYGTVNPFLIRQGQHIHINNNIFYAAHAMGGNPDHVINSWFLNYPDTASSSIVRFRGTDSVSYWYNLWGGAAAGAITGPEAYENDARGVTANMVAPTNRVIEVKNNDFFLPQKLLDFYTSYNDTVTAVDSIQVPVYGSANEIPVPLKRVLYKPTWMSDYTMWTLDTLLAGKATINVANNIESDPGFNSDVQTQLDSLILYVWKITTNHLDHPWFYNPNASFYPPAWPLPENLAYTSSSLQSGGSDGFAVGDLNWFPSQKAAWEQGATAVNDAAVTPNKFSLSQNYPNPFNPTTTITFNLAKSGYATLSVYNVLGQKVATLVSGNLNAGSHQINFNASNLSSGVYFYRLESDNNTSIKKMMLLK